MNTPFRRDTLLPPVPPALAETPVRCDQVLPAPPPTGPLAGGCDWSAQGPPPALSVTVGGGVAQDRLFSSLIVEDTRKAQKTGELSLGPTSQPGLGSSEACNGRAMRQLGNQIKVSFHLKSRNHQFLIQND